MSVRNMVTEKDNKFVRATSCMSRICNREGVVWAKMLGYRPWPARIITEEERNSEPSFKQADKYKTAEDDTLVYYFGSNDVSWLCRSKSIHAWKAGLKKGFHIQQPMSKAFRQSLEKARKYCEEQSGVEF